MTRHITIDNRRHRFSIIPQTDPGLPDAAATVEVCSDDSPQRLFIRSGMTLQQTATAAAHLVSVLWMNTAGLSSDSDIRPGRVQIGTTRFQLEMSRACEGFDIDHQRRLIRVKPGEPMDVAHRAAMACDCAWQVWRDRITAKALAA